MNPRIDQLNAGQLRKILLEQQAILDNATVGILFSRNRVVVACNALCAEMFGYSPEEMIDLRGQELYPSAQAYAELGNVAGPTLAAGQPYHAEVEYRRKDGTLFWSRVSAKAVDPLNTQGGTIWIIEDISAERSIREALAKAKQESDDRVRAALAEQELIFNNAAVGMVFVRNRIVRRCNRKFEEIFGYAQGELIGNSTLVFYPTVRDYDQQWERAYEPLCRGETVSGEERMRRKDGSLFWVRTTGRKTDAPGLGLDVIWIFEDVSGRHQAEEALVRAQDEMEQRVVERTSELTTTNQQLQTEIFERMEAEQRIWHIAHHDALTGLPNRSLLHDRLDQALTQAARSEHRLAVMFLDLDRFKSVNDTLGHHVGDQLLKHVAERLREAVRAVDIVSRLGGDEFVVILPEVQGPDDAIRVAQKIIAALAPAVTLDGNLLHATPSIGISIFPDHGSEAYGLMKHADTAMYHAKAGGRNTFRFFEPGMNSAGA